MLKEPFHVSHICPNLCWSLEMFGEVWNQEVTWNDKLYPCWNDSIKEMESWVTNQTLQTCSYDTRWIIQQKSWRVHVELMSRKCFNWPKILFGALSGYYFDQGERLTSVAVMRFDPKWKLWFCFCRRNFIQRSRTKSACKQFKQRLEVRISCCFSALRNSSKSLEGQQWVSSFVTFYYANSYGNSIIFLNMSWSTLLDESNGSSIIKFGVHLDVQK
jgi:hypothetical protein